MKFVTQRSSKRDKNVPVFEFAFCAEEMRLMHGLLKDYHLKMPKIFETSQVRARLSNITREFEKTIAEYNKK